MIYFFNISMMLNKILIQLFQLDVTTKAQKRPLHHGYFSNLLSQSIFRPQIKIETKSFFDLK